MCELHKTNIGCLNCIVSLGNMYTVPFYIVWMLPMFVTEGWDFIRPSVAVSGAI